VPIPSSALAGLPGDNRLRQLDLSADELREAIHVGYTAASTCTAHDPLSLPGTLAWGKGIGHVRDLTAPRDWKADRDSNYETAVHPSNSHAVALAAGTPDTGREDGLPRTKTPKGPATGRAVKRNAQLPLGHETDVFAGTGEPVDDSARETWLLLHYYDKDAEEIRVELSCPMEMKGKQITQWRERIILEPIPFSEDVDIDLDDDGDIDIDIQRKAD
jgi:hypothetical protein